MNLPFRDDSFSSSIFSEVVEEIPDPVAAISGLSRCSLRLIIKTSPIRSDVFYTLAKRAKRALRKDATEFAHVNEMHPDVLLLILSKRMRVRRVSFFNPFHVWNIVALFPLLRKLDLSPLDSTLGFKSISSGVLFVAER